MRRRGSWQRAWAKVALRGGVALACAGCVTVGIATAASSGETHGRHGPEAGRPVQSGSSAPTTASNKRRAFRDAKHLMATVVTPRGAVLRSSATASGPYARPLTAASASVVVRRRWTVPGDPASVLSFVQAHLPAGAKLFSTGGGGPPSYQSVTYSWPVVQGVLDVRWLYISAGSRRGGGTVLYAESQSQWVITRPRDEQIPAGVRQVDVTSGWPGRPPFLSRRVTDSAKVGKLVRLFDSLEIVQPIAISCPAFKAAPIVTVTFSTGTTGRVLARASVSADTNFSWPPSLPGWACIPISFSVRGQPRTPLVGNVIRPIHHLLHVRLDRG